ncbi:MAG TPA: fructosamine kinase family protein [Chitinophagaceae bacterium]|nr:fructosamine kinase family protein [Chitinophagaceae bacterium]
MLLKGILEDCGVTINRYEPVPGGDINHCYCLYAHNAKYFLKVNDAKRYSRMFEKEANGLQALSNGLPTLERMATLIVPEVIKCGIEKQQQYLLLEWIEAGKAKSNSWENFGAALATMHQQPQSYFGWEEDNFIGNLPQYNTKHNSWHLFYTECRIMPLVEMLFNAGAFNKQNVIDAENLCKRFEQLFPQEPPALLHGDLWSGNFMITSTGEAAIYDPAVYYGHREMDIGMTKLFGGFDQRFYTAYNEVYPLEKSWLQRLSLAQLYPLLVHAALFGGHYVMSVRNIIKQF